MSIEKDLERLNKSAYEFLVPVATKSFQISEVQAKLRVQALIESRLLLTSGHPAERPFEEMINTAMQIPQLHEKPEREAVETGVAEKVDGYAAWFKIGVQTFFLPSVPDETYAKWHEGNLKVAFGKI